MSYPRGKSPRCHEGLNFIGQRGKPVQLHCANGVGKELLRCLLNLSGFYLLNYYLQLSPEHPPQPFYLRAIFKLTVCLLPRLNHANSQLITHERSNLLCLSQKNPTRVQACTPVHFCSCHEAAPAEPE